MSSGVGGENSMNFHHNKAPANKNTKQISIKKINLNLISYFRFRFVYLFEWIINSFDLLSFFAVDSLRGWLDALSDWIIFMNSLTFFVLLSQINVRTVEADEPCRPIVLNIIRQNGCLYLDRCPITQLPGKSSTENGNKNVFHDRKNVNKNEAS